MQHSKHTINTLFFFKSTFTVAKLNSFKKLQVTIPIFLFFFTSKSKRVVQLLPLVTKA